MEAVRKALWLVAVGLFLVALIALTAVSVEQGYIAVLKALLTSNGLSGFFWIGAVIAAVIPIGFLTVYACILIVMCGTQIWKSIDVTSHQRCRSTSR